jgi:hypothetical protein
VANACGGSLLLTANMLQCLRRRRTSAWLLPGLPPSMIVKCFVLPSLSQRVANSIAGAREYLYWAQKTVVSTPLLSVHSDSIVNMEPWTAPLVQCPQRGGRGGGGARRMPAAPLRGALKDVFGKRRISRSRSYNIQIHYVVDWPLGGQKGTRAGQIFFEFFLSCF